MIKLLFPLILSAGIALWVGQKTAEREIAVVKTTEELHFQELQRSLSRIESWMARQERK